MSNKNNDLNIKEKFKQALESTVRVISEDFELKNENKISPNSKKLNSFDLDNLNTKNDFIKARANSDSAALKKKFSNEDVYKQNLPSNTSCKSLYSIAEKNKI